MKVLLAGNTWSCVSDSAKSDRDGRADPDRHGQGPFCALTQCQMLTGKLWMTLGCLANYQPLEQPKMSLSPSWGSFSIPTDFCCFFFFFSHFLSHLRVTKSTHVTNAAGISVLLTQLPESTSTGLMLHFCSCAQVVLPSLATLQYLCQSKKLNPVFGCILFLPDYSVLNVDSITLQNSV